MWIAVVLGQMVGIVLMLVLMVVLIRFLLVATRWMNARVDELEARSKSDTAEDYGD